MSQESHPIAYFNEKLNDIRYRYSTYDKEFYAVIQSLRYWQHTQLPQEFFIFSNHETLCYINSQKKLNTRHGQWVEFLHECTYSLRHKVGVENKATDALNRRMMTTTEMRGEIIGFEQVKEDYLECPDFKEVYSLLSTCSECLVDDFLLEVGYLFKAQKLCIPNTSLREFLVSELHPGGLVGHFGRDKTIEAVEYRFFWPSLKKYVDKIVSVNPDYRLPSCKLATGRWSDSGRAEFQRMSAAGWWPDGVWRWSDDSWCRAVIRRLMAARWWSDGDRAIVQSVDRSSPAVVLGWSSMLHRYGYNDTDTTRYGYKTRQFLKYMIRNMR
ncbi:hypothetical protein KFK09_001451 [Dendrobium nobile]|uniref:Integrase zinc-binding domain-containing protein n=1 Tax=Dendrobium nobile TaxID=94219 RepID=A0A8T3C7C9_DENNO|nr:hypothetical protein KFK09_001451 [Dendrobium nobile]